MKGTPNTDFLWRAVNATPLTRGFVRLRRDFAPDYQHVAPTGLFTRRGCSSRRGGPLHPHLPLPLQLKPLLRQLPIHHRPRQVPGIHRTGHRPHHAGIVTTSVDALDSGLLKFVHFDMSHLGEFASQLAGDVCMLLEWHRGVDGLEHFPGADGVDNMPDMPCVMCNLRNSGFDNPDVMSAKFFDLLRCQGWFT